MKIRREEMTVLKRNELTDIFAAIGIGRDDIPGICGVTPHAVGRWRQSERIPLMHLKSLKTEFDKKVGKRANLTPIEERAKKIFLSAFVRSLSYDTTRDQEVSSNESIESFSIDEKLSMLDKSKGIYAAGFDEGRDQGFDIGYQLAIELLLNSDFKGEAKHFAAWLWERKDASDRLKKHKETNK